MPLTRGRNRPTDKNNAIFKITQYCCLVPWAGTQQSRAANIVVDMSSIMLIKIQEFCKSCRASCYFGAKWQNSCTILVQEFRFILFYCKWANRLTAACCVYCILYLIIYGHHSQHPPRLRDDLLCVEWGVKPYTLTRSIHVSDVSCMAPRISTRQIIRSADMSDRSSREILSRCRSYRLVSE